MSDGATFALADIGWIDFETRSTIDLKKAGAYRYAVDAHAIVLAHAIGAAEPSCAAVKTFGRPLRWLDLPEDIIAHQARVERGEAVWAAWNAGFDRAIWNHATLGFPELKPHHVIDVMAQAAASGLPPDLARAAKASGSIGKIVEGWKLITMFCEPPESFATPQTHPAEWRAFLDYAVGDIASARSIFLGTRQLPLNEWCEYWAMEAVNERGVGIDLAMVEHAAAIVVEDKQRTADELFKMTGTGVDLKALVAGHEHASKKLIGLVNSGIDLVTLMARHKHQAEELCKLANIVTTVDQVERMTVWLLKQLSGHEEAVDILVKQTEERDEDSGEIVRPPKYELTRTRVERLIAFCADRKELAGVLRLLQLRLYGGGKAPAKFSRMLGQHVDGMLKGQYVFNGAPQTGRASSKSVQIHNLTRDALPYEADAIDTVLRGACWDELAALGDDTPVVRKLALLVRPSLVPAPGNVFVWSDWSQIEARVLPWLTGDSPGALKRLDIFAAVDVDPTVPDLYTRTAADISHLPISEVTKPIRQRGKVAELALGFLGGVGALQAMGASYGIHLSDQEAVQIVERWRAANQWAVIFGGYHGDENSYGLWGAVNRALEHPGSTQRVGRISYAYAKNYLGGTLLCTLPSGRYLTYRDIRYEKVADLDEDGNNIGYSTHLRHSRGYSRAKLWKGIFCENVTQATAADFLRGTLRRLADEGYCVRIHTHDEILVEAPEDRIDAVKAALHEIMCRGFEWSKGLPLMSEETAAYCYTKDENSHIR